MGPHEMMWVRWFLGGAGDCTADLALGPEKWRCRFQCAVRHREGHSASPTFPCGCARAQPESYIEHSKMQCGLDGRRRLRRLGAPAGWSAPGSQAESMRRVLSGSARLEPLRRGLGCAQRRPGLRAHRNSGCCPCNSCSVHFQQPDAATSPARTCLVEVGPKVADGGNNPPREERLLPASTARSPRSALAWRSTKR